jgi:HEAT repeat protein
MTDPKLLADLESFGERSVAAARRLAEIGDRAAFGAILRSHLRDCGFEQPSKDKGAALARLGGPAEAREIVRVLDGLDDADLEDDAGDISDEFWRIRSTLTRVLATMGPAVADVLREAVRSPNPGTRECAAEALTGLGM